MSEPIISPAFAQEIREKMKQKLPRLIEWADAGDDHSLRLLFTYCPLMEKKLIEWAESGRDDARELLHRLYRARAERQALLALR